MTRRLLAAAVLLAASMTVTGRASAAVNCPPTPGKVTVAVVIDDDRAAPSVECWTVSEGTTGSQLLALRAERLGRPAPRYDRSGLLCAIDGYPTSGCGQPSGDGAFIYWSYWWRIPSGWKYATTGPATKVLRNGDVEGWHFVVGRGTGTDLAPRLDPSTITFDTPVTTTAPPAAPTTTRAVPLATEPPVAPRPPVGAAPIPAPPVGRPSPTAPAPTTTVPAGVAGVTTTVVDPVAPTTTVPPVTTTTTVDGRDDRAAPVLVDDEAGGSGLGGVLGGLGIMAVAIPAAVLWIRRRRMAPDHGFPDASP